ncbi:MAG: hypothetical protein GF333_02530 [Candidatus Omnitrophica bacterium]|nr:hypothetical protein [Candidatus Omnitrophota bacterium]
MRGFLRIWKKFDLEEVEKHLIVVGELSSECYACHHLGLDARDAVCPQCGAAFKYMGFRRHLTMNYLQKLNDELPHMTFIDFEDFKKVRGKRDARRLLDM